MFGNIMPRSSYRTAYFIALSSKKLHMLFKDETNDALENVQSWKDSYFAKINLKYQLAKNLILS